MTIGDRIRACRTKAGLTQTELAARAETGQVYISNLESGKKADPSLSTLRRIAGALGISVSTLVRGL